MVRRQGAADPLGQKYRHHSVRWSTASAFITTWEVQFLGATPESYLLPLAFATGERAFRTAPVQPARSGREISPSGKTITTAKGCSTTRSMTPILPRRCFMRSSAAPFQRREYASWRRCQPKAFRKLRGDADAHSGTVDAQTRTEQHFGGLRRPHDLENLPPGY